MKGSSRADDLAAAQLAAGVAAYGLGLGAADLIGPERGGAEVVFGRQVAMYLCHVGFEFSLARVAIAFGRDRSTVAHACHLIEDRRDDESFDDWLAGLEAMLREAPPPAGKVRLWA